jgi:hypothetical protein
MNQKVKVAERFGLLVQVWLLTGLLVAGRAVRADLVITEIHYDPVDGAGAPAPDLEFVELYNDGPEAYDLSGCAFTGGIGFVFAEGTFIRGRSYLVVCRNRIAVQSTYGITGALGNFAGALDNGGENLTLSNPQGVPVVEVSYNERGQWPSGAQGTGHSLSLRYEYLDPSDADNWSLSAQLGGTPGSANFGGSVTFQDTVIIPASSTWRYFKGTQNPPATWTQVSFNDASWLSGSTGIGYGDGDDATELTDMQNSYLSIFCRRTFNVADVSAIDTLILKVTYDDGFAVYLNGVEVGAVNLSGRNFDSTAGGAVEPTLAELNLSGFQGQLVNGTNVLAVSMHNSGLNSSDLSFIPELVSRTTVAPGSTSTVPVVVNEGHFRVPSASRFVELYNTSNASVDLSGYHLTDDFSDLTKFTIAGGTSIPARGYRSFSEAQLGFDLSIVDVVKPRVAIALVNPAGTRVVDARIFEPALDGKSEARLPDGNENFAPAADPTPGAANAVTVVCDVIFNEIHYHPLSGLESEEFIEFYNRGASAVDLSGWRVDGVDYEFPPGTTIAAGAYLVIVRDPARIRTLYGLGPTVVLAPGWNGSIKDGGERLELIDPLGNVADQVRFYDGGEWAFWADGRGSSLERIDVDADGSNAATWDASDDSADATPQTLTYTATHGGGESDFGMMLLEEGIAIIDDVELAPAAGGANLISNGNFDANTTPWRIEGTHIRSGRTTAASERITGAGSLKLICWNGGGDYKVNRIELDTGTQTNGASYRITYRARWVVGGRTVLTIGDYSSGNPSSAGIAGARQLQVPTRFGTPGAINSVQERQIARTGSVNIGPSIDRVSHSPGVPEASEAVTVSARVRDPDGTSAVALFYRTNSAGGAFTQLAMADADGDGVFTATIPGQTIGTRVIFYVQATDALGQVSRFPADIFSRTHPPVLNPASPAANDARYCMYRHDTRYPSTSFHSYRFVLNQESETELSTRRVLSNFMLDGTFVFGGTDVYYNAGVRFAGSPWLRPGGGTWGKSYSIRMPSENPLHGRKKSFNLDNHATDGRERLAHFLLRRNAGSTRLPYFDSHSLVRYQLNSVHTATYEALDKPNRQYIQFWFPDDDQGAHYEMDDRFAFNDSGARTGNADGRALYPPYGATSGGGNKENYRWFFATRNHEGDDDFLPLQDLCRFLDERLTPNPSFDQGIFNIVDVEEFLRVWAIEMNIDDWDTWGGRRGKNCYLYRAPSDGRWRLIPWDVELTFGDVNAFSLPASPSSTYGNFFSEITRFVNRPRLKRMFYGILKEQVDSFFTGGASPLSAYVSQLSGSGVGNTGTVTNFVNSRANLIRGWIQSSVYPTLRLVITTNGGNPITSTSPTVDLAGNAPAEVFTFLITRNGELLDDAGLDFVFSLANMTGWSVDDVPLAPGTNQIAILGYNSQGGLVDQDSIQITNTGAWDPPVITSVVPDPVGQGEGLAVNGSDFHNGLRVFFNGTIEASGVSFNETLDPTRITLTVPVTVPAGAATVTVRNIDGQSSNAASLTVLPPEPVFVRADGNLDGIVDLSDALRVLFFLFSGTTVTCLDALDADDNGSIEMTDSIYTLDFLFRRGSPPPAPYPGTGRDPTDTDSLGCEMAF